MLAASRTIRSGRSSRSGEPGTRLAWGTRFGRPADVSAATAGGAAFSAARQPGSDGVAHSRGAAVAGRLAVDQAQRRGFVARGGVAGRAAEAAVELGFDQAQGRWLGRHV